MRVHLADDVTVTSVVRQVNIKQLPFILHTCTAHMHDDASLNIGAVFIYSSRFVFRNY